ncbi:MAG: S-methyl-5'-thioadenosine phosphorylase [Candidatus Marinimicrobia bacterium]|nr:S-methyl-5'-thioadenosine phosphorylase [Candidatus Neomarinimicrobiota bacterium]MCF7830073.1 S-methyl-5'-thioadenosine phosphorylase [Candidatus Neomarinimicrobiota bacterium]MCF7882120.1 S-methyl-5'-thioadenosine phosphorylase [Candidatus Neomarinimicrobiota bacterium]
MAQQRTIGIIGGTGFYDIPGIKWDEDIEIDTPFGAPSDAYRLGTFNDLKIVFLARHGRQHHIMPSEINVKANIYGMKSLGVEWILTTSAVGSFREDLPPQDMVVVDQFVDRTKTGARHTFFGDGVIAHIGFSHPICDELATHFYNAGKSVTDNIHKGGTYLNIEGPAFSTRAESILYKSWGMDVIGMTSLAEAKLAREAEMCFSTLAIVTDYDSWHEGLDAVSTTAVIENFQKAVVKAREVVAAALQDFTLPRECKCESALEDALLTDPATIPLKKRQDMGVILEKYLPEE